MKLEDSFVDTKMVGIIALALIFASFISSIYFFLGCRGRWRSIGTSKGRRDGYASKFWGLFPLPSTLIGVDLLLFTVPRIDPLKESIQKFRGYYDESIVVFSGFLLWIHLYMILWNLGIMFPIGIALLPAYALLLYYLGVLRENARRNWFIGIRTPWTLSSDKVWEKTHKIGGRLFKIAGIATFTGIFFEGYELFFILIPVISVATYTIAYSYLEYRKEEELYKAA